MEYHEIYNLAGCEAFAEKKRKRFERSKASYEDDRKKIFGYDCNRYGLTYDDKLKVVAVREAVRDFTRGCILSI
ncbi:MAG: hypothetical protein LBP79_02535 [Clostridiales bacterium]|jgi:hypothetical protein|nr:hypothetical protein [Clostridiales bacterium]